VEPTLLSEAICRVPAEARADYTPPDAAEYQSCIALQVRVRERERERESWGCYQPHAPPVSLAAANPSRERVRRVGSGG
jgi:hypothetical protein